MDDLIGGILGGLFCWPCRFIRHLLGWETERERERWETPKRDSYVPPTYVPAPRSAAERDATRTKIRERVAARRARDAQRRNQR